jgi:hypothetical protein
MAPPGRAGRRPAGRHEPEPADQHQRVDDVSEAGGGDQAHGEAEAQREPVGGGDDGARRARHEGHGHRSRAQRQRRHREGETSRHVGRQQIARQRAGRRGPGGPLAEREEQHVLGERPRVGERDRQHGEHGERDCRGTGPYRGPAAGGHGEQGESDGQQGPGGPLQRRGGAEREPGGDGTAPAREGERETHQGDDREVDTADGEGQGDGGSGREPEEGPRGAVPGRPGARVQQRGESHRAERHQREPEPGVRERDVAKDGTGQAEERHAG